MSLRAADAKESNDSKNTSNTKLYVGNLDPRVTEYHIIQLFRPFGEIVKEDFAWHTHGPKKGEPRGFCFVEYATKEAAQIAMRKMHGKQVLNRTLDVHFSDTQPRPQASKPNNFTPVIPADPTPINKVALSKEAMDAKIFAIKSKLKLMEKEEPEIKQTRFQPYTKRNNNM